MSKKMKKNSFIEGTFIAYVSIIITKILGALYGIPFYAIIGEQGGVIYACAYSVYALFLNISTSGIPTAVSIIISEYNSTGLQRTKQRAYSVGLRLVGGISLAAFIVLQVFAGKIGLFFLGGMEGGVSVNDIEISVRVVSLCLLIVPFLSVKRGYLQGHKFISASSYSQIIEQLVRILVVLAGSFITIKVMGLSVTFGICTALSGAALGAVAAMLYLQRKCRESRSLIETASAAEEPPVSTGEIVRKIFSYCITIVIVAVSLNIYDIVDMKMVLTGLYNLGYDAETTQTISSIIATWIPKICMIIAALSMGLTSSIVPHIAGSYAEGNLKEVNFKLNQALGTILVVSTPMAVGIILLSDPTYRLFYGPSPYGGQILQLAVIVNVISSMTTVVSMAMQSMNRGKSVCIFTVIGLVLNAALDLPMIYLFDSIGIPAYLGASASSIIGQTVTVTGLLMSLKRDLHFKYSPVLRIFLRVLLPNAAMAAAVLIIKRLIPTTDGRNMILVAQMILYAVIGAAVYALTAYKTKALTDVMGADFFDKIRKKLKLEKR